jgi:hypothetical protein
MYDINKQNFDGSINSFWKTKSLGHGYYIPFDNETFKNQIEENILTAVMLLNLSGYKTVSSCHGHSEFDRIFKKALRSNSGPQITVAVPNNDLLYFQKHFRSFFISTQVNNTIEITDPNCTYISIFSRPIVSKILPNKFLCNHITKLCESFLNEHV